MTDPSAAAGGRTPGDLSIDPTRLYREEVFTDLEVATLRRLVPVKPDGSDDPGRSSIWAGETQVMTSVGMIPVSARMEVETLAEAVAQFPAAIELAIHELMEQAREMQRREASGLIIPRGPLPPDAAGKLRSGGLELP